MTDYQFLRTLADNKHKNKEIILKFFKAEDLQIIIKCNLKIVDYLDVTLNLNDGKYRPFHKTNEKTTYIHVESDRPPQIVKKIPRSIEARLSRLSSRKEIFENLKDYYEQRLRQCGYNEKLNYIEQNNEINQKSRKRNVLWFNPPYSKSVKTKIGKLFLRLITHKYRKIVYRNTIKISCSISCMSNIKSKISTQQKDIR